MPFINDQSARKQVSRLPPPHTHTVRSSTMQRQPTAPCSSSVVRSAFESNPGHAPTAVPWTTQAATVRY